MPKFSVKKPFTIVVGVIMLLVLGFVSFTRMTTDLLPSMNIPYLIVVTTYPGASPEKVESSVTQPLEAGLGTVNGVEAVSSTSNENYSMVMLEFAEDTNMDSAMVKVTTQLDQMELPDTVGKPMVMEMSMDMIATMQVSVDYKGMDIYELTDFVDETVIPYLERQSGVASVNPTGLVEKSVEVRLDQDKIDDINDKLLTKVNKELAKALEWDYDASLVNVPIFFVSSTGNGDENLVVSGEQLKDIYSDVPDSVTKIMARRTDADHGDMLSFADGYMTAWFMWQLQGDQEAAKAFVGDDAEILANPLYQDQQVKIQK